MVAGKDAKFAYKWEPNWMTPDVAEVITQSADVRARTSTKKQYDDIITKLRIVRDRCRTNGNHKAVAELDTEIAAMTRFAKAKGLDQYDAMRERALGEIFERI